MEPTDRPRRLSETPASALHGATVASRPVVDLRRTVAAQVVADIDADGVAPGDVEVRAIDGVVWGYAFRCPGCRAADYLPISADNAGPRWSVDVGDVARPETVSLSPSILHLVDRGGCGWHGHLRAGRFEPC